MDVQTTAPNRPLVNGPLPGPESRRLLAEQDRHESNTRTYPRRIPIAIKQAQGAFVEDVDGNVFIDFLMGAGALGLGHNHPAVVAAVRQQADVLSHGLDFPTPIKDEFTKAHLAMLPAVLRDRMRMQFCGPTGADAVEAAIKLCKFATGRTEVVAFQGSYHGCTHAGLALSGDTTAKERFGALMPGVHFAPFPYCYRCPLGLRPTSCDTNCAHYLENVLTDPQSGIAKPAAVIIELVQGEGGAIAAPVDFVRRLRAVTRSLDIPLILDEIQSGCGRTGTWFSFETYGIEPDVILSSKAIGAGLPLSVVFFDKRLDVWPSGSHIGTFRGSQLAFAAGVAALRVVQSDGVLDNVVRQGRFLLDGLASLKGELAIVGDVRGRGLLLGVEIVDPATNRQSGAIARHVQQRLLERGLLIEVVGRDDAVIKLLPPLTLDRATATVALEILTHCLRAVDAEWAGEADAQADEELVV
ncbi:MAG TPA: diaminobutyrate--2-oxoglutarate transaminase family protein [Acidimicrobiales bacterium]|jgi:diaminobutyrate-2-oxoglutarate transaminase|nr:diaminobutyrate--2-oxoglutarate transaminase family protein [Acidimicrobiales bacterium]